MSDLQTPSRWRLSGASVAVALLVLAACTTPISDPDYYAWSDAPRRLATDYQVAADLSLIGTRLQNLLRSGAVRAAPGRMHPVDAWLADSPADATEPMYHEVLSTQATDSGARYLIVGHQLDLATHDLLDQEDSWGLACAVLTVSLTADATTSTVNVQEQNVRTEHPTASPTIEAPTSTAAVSDGG